MIARCLAWTLFGLGLSLGCADPGAWGGDAPAQLERADAWNAGEAPGRFGANLGYRLDQLPLSGSPAIAPWAGSHWAVHQDSINFPWAGAETPSAAAKYDAAFGGGGQTEDAVSRTHGVDSAEGQPGCGSSSECADGERCAVRAGAQVGRCIPTWWGISRGAAAAAIAVPEPLHTVTRNNVIFEVQDLKALASLAFADVEAEVGMPLSNAGAFHVALANRVGLQQQSVVEDRTVDGEVWSRPVAGYRVLEMRRVSGREANQLLGGYLEVGSYPRRYLYNPDAKSLYFVRTEVSTVVNAPSELGGNLSGQVQQFTVLDRYEYVLEVDGRGKVIGGEYFGDSAPQHPDFIWAPHGRPSTQIAEGHIDFDALLGLLEESVAPCDYCSP